MSYQPKVYKKQGGNTLVVLAADGGAIEGQASAGAAPAQSAAIVDASTAHALNATFSDTEVETALNNLGTKINSIILALEKVGILAS